MEVRVRVPKQRSAVNVKFVFRFLINIKFVTTDETLWSKKYVKLKPKKLFLILVILIWRYEEIKKSNI